MNPETVETFEKNLSYFECYIASKKLQRLSRINNQWFLCGDDAFKFRVITCRTPSVKIFRCKKGSKHQSFYDEVDISFDSVQSILDVVREAVERLPEGKLKTQGGQELTVEQLAHYLES